MINSPDWIQGPGFSQDPKQTDDSSVEKGASSFKGIQFKYCLEIIDEQQVLKISYSDEHVKDKEFEVRIARGLGANQDCIASLAKNSVRLISMYGGKDLKHAAFTQKGDASVVEKEGSASLKDDEIKYLRAKKLSQVALHRHEGLGIQAGKTQTVALKTFKLFEKTSLQFKTPSNLNLPSSLSTSPTIALTACEAPVFSAGFDLGFFKKLHTDCDLFLKTAGDPIQGNLTRKI